MKKSTFVALVMGIVSGTLFALGMCMALLPEWNAFKEGVILGVIGLVLAVAAVFIWRKMENKAPIKLTGKTILTITIGIIGALTLGIGMCLCLVYSKMLLGIVIGLAGILILLFLIPLTVGIKK